MNTGEPRHEGLETLQAAVVRVQDLSVADRLAMFELFAHYFANVRFERFAKDLDEKEWVVLTRSQPSATVQRFSTFRLLHAEVDGQPVQAIFNGDTVHAPQNQARTELGLQVFLRFLLALKEERGLAPLYWLVMTATHKTYCYLPFLLKTYYPSPHWPTPPDVLRCRDAMARVKFPDEFDPAAGIVRLKEPTPYLPGQAPVTPAKRHNPHLKLFMEQNPGFKNGDFLVCLAEFSRANLTDAGLRLVDGDLG